MTMKGLRRTVYVYNFFNRRDLSIELRGGDQSRDGSRGEDMRYLASVRTELHHPL